MKNTVYVTTATCMNNTYKTGKNIALKGKAMMTTTGTNLIFCCDIYIKLMKMIIIFKLQLRHRHYTVPFVNNSML